jgi:hypothetical protein
MNNQVAKVYVACCRREYFSYSRKILSWSFCLQLGFSADSVSRNRCEINCFFTHWILSFAKLPVSPTKRNFQFRQRNETELNYSKLYNLKKPQSKNSIIRYFSFGRLKKRDFFLKNSSFRLLFVSQWFIHIIPIPFCIAKWFKTEFCLFSVSSTLNLIDYFCYYS